MKTLLPALLALSICSNDAASEVPGRKNTADAHVAGTTLIHFGRVDEGVYKGSRPETDADYRFLQSHHIKYILDLELLPSIFHKEQKKAEKYGIQLMQVRLNASPISPSEKHIGEVMAILRDRKRHPVYFHCVFGRDRTSLVAGLYKVYFLGMSPQNAWRYMKQSGYKESWLRSGLKRYLQDHPTPPPGVH